MGANHPNQAVQPWLFKRELVRSNYELQKAVIRTANLIQSEMNK